MSFWNVASLSARRAWIENASSGVDFAEDWVALRKESVDRKGDGTHGAALPRVVALRKESVDRKVHIGHRQPGALLSLSARRAWIEKLI